MTAAHPFSELRVIDFTHVLAGPACSYFLGLLGAEVIKVESVGRGDSVRVRGGTDRARAAAGMSTHYQTQGGGKRSLAVDIADPRGFEVMVKLLKSADVFVENHRPSLMTKLGLDDVQVNAINPRIIHCALTGYGRGGPKADVAAYDVNIQAACGLMTMSGTEDSGPIRTGAPIMDYGTALSGGFAIAAALYERSRTGQGTFIDVSMLETALTMMSSSVADYQTTGNAPKQRGNAANSGSPASGSFETQEGMLSLGINEEHQFHLLAEVLGCPQWRVDPRFIDRQARAAHVEELNSKLSAILATRTAIDWENEMQRAGVPAARVRTLPECLLDRQVQERSFMHRYADEGAGNVSVPTLPFRIEGADVHAPAFPPPARGQHSVEILKELQLSDDIIEGMLSEGIVEQHPGENQTSEEPMS